MAMDEELNYGEVMTPVDMPEEAEVSTVDDANYDTLAEVQKDMHEFKELLFANFNTFEIDLGKDKEARLAALEDDLRIRQGVWTLLEPLVEKVNNAVLTINVKRNN